MITRPATSADIPNACQLLNDIIEIGGTTAYEEALTESQFNAEFLVGENCICCFACVNQAGEVLGFQALSRKHTLPENWGNIATFARAKPKSKGVGTQLFAATQAFVQSNNIVAINATIRADNVSGLAYYNKMGFIDYKIEEAVPMNDGTPIDRIYKRYDVAT